MLKSEFAVLSALLGRKSGNLKLQAGPYRDVTGGIFHKAALRLQAEGLCVVRDHGRYFIAYTHAMNEAR